MNRISLKIALIFLSASCTQCIPKNHLEKKFVKNNAIIVMLAVILLLTLLFEWLHEALDEALEHRHLSHAKKILTGVFKELTVLGFVSFILFMLTRQGFIMKLNDKLFGVNQVEKTGIKELKEEGEAKENAPTELKEIIEEVHIFVFTIMVAFSLIMLGIMSVVLYTAKKWRRYEIESAYDVQEPGLADGASADHMEYWALRYKFLNSRNAFIPSLSRSSFAFSEYAVGRLSDVVSELVEIPLGNWIAFVSLIFILRPFLSFSGFLLLAFFLVFALAILSCTYALYYDVNSQLNKILPDRRQLVSYLGGSVMPGFGEPLISVIDTAEVIKKNSNTCILMQGVTAINRQEAMFLFGCKGPMFHMRLMQFLLFLHALALTVLGKFFSSSVVFKSDNTTINLVGLGVPFVLVAVSLFTVWPLLLQKFAMLTSFGFFVKPEFIAKCTEEKQKRSLARKQQIINMLYHKSDIHFAAKGTSEYERELEQAKIMYSKLSQRSQRSLQDMFHAFSDMAEVPHITPMSVFNLIRVFGIDQRVPDCDEIVDGWMTRLDKENNNSLGFAEFITLFLHLIEDELEENVTERKTRQQIRLKELANTLDRDKDGFITMEEIMENLSRMRPAVTEEEIKSIMAEIEGGRFGEMVRPENLMSWVAEIEEVTRLLRSASSEKHIHAHH